MGVNGLDRSQKSDSSERSFPAQHEAQKSASSWLGKVVSLISFKWMGAYFSSSADMDDSKKEQGVHDRDVVSKVGAELENSYEDDSGIESDLDADPFSDSSDDELDFEDDDQFFDAVQDMGTTNTLKADSQQTESSKINDLPTKEADIILNPPAVDMSPFIPASAEENQQRMHEQLELLYQCKAPMLEQVRPFLELYQCELLRGELDMEVFEEHLEKIGRYFKEVHYLFEFGVLSEETLQKTLHRFIEVVPEQTLVKLLDSRFTCETFQSEMRGLVTGLVTHALRNRSESGEWSELIHAKDLKLLKIIDQTEVFKSKALGELIALNPALVGSREEAKSSLEATFLSQMRSDIDQVTKDVGFTHLHQRLESLDIQQVERLLQKTQLTKTEQSRLDEALDVVCLGKKALLDLQLGLGDRWAIDSLMLAKGWSDQEHFQSFMKLLKIDAIRDDRIDLMQLKLMQKTHEDHVSHPVVVIEGAGPSGLLTALTQFQAGARVSVFEARSTQYERPQIVRLDRKWMQTLKFYLGEKYFELFDREHGSGRMEPDGFGHIVIKRLEDRLHQRLSELNAWVNNPEKLDRKAFYVLNDLEETPQKGKFFVTASFNKGSAPDRGKLDASSEQEVVRQPVDVLICAGGKNSPLCTKFLEPQVFSQEKIYGVASWSLDKKINARQTPVFAHFRNTLLCDDILSNTFSDKVKTAIGTESVIYQGCEPSVQNSLDQACVKLETFKSELNDVVVQTRTFENDGLIYIGMEMPEPVLRYFNDIETSIAKNDEYTGKNIMRLLQQCWFQTVADQYRLHEMGVNETMMDRKFSVVFPLTLHRLEEETVVKKGYNSSVVITATGDAKASPHFMSASGLTGAREDIRHLSLMTECMASAPEGGLSQDQLIKKVEEDRLQVSGFISGQGIPFWYKATHGKILQR